jgi:hypothetical protein
LISSFNRFTDALDLLNPARSHGGALGCRDSHHEPLAGRPVLLLAPRAQSGGKKAHGKKKNWLNFWVEQQAAAISDDWPRLFLGEGCVIAPRYRAVCGKCGR